MTTQTLDLLKDIFFLLFFLTGTLWLWGKVKLKAENQAYLEKLFAKSRTRFKWMFLIGLLLIGGLFIWQYVLGK